MDTDWEELYQNGVSPWDKGAPAPPLIEWLNQNPQSMKGRILVPGCGFGHDSRLLSEMRPRAEVLGIDVSETALKQAQVNAGSESYAELDLFDLPGELNGAFDWIWEHTCFCAISPDRREEYVTAVHGALKSEGELLAVFYLDPYDDEHRPGEGPPHGTSEEELQTRFIESGYFTLLEKYVPEVSYPGREGLELMMRMRKAQP